MDGQINSRGQLAMITIVALVIVAAIVIFFLVRKSTIIGSGNEFSPENFVRGCVKQSTEEAIGILMPQGGFIEPENYKLYKNTKVAYLCENIGFYKTCVNQHPLLLREVTKEITDYISPKAEACFQQLESEMDKRNYDVNFEKNLSISVVLKPKNVEITANKKISFSKNGQNRGISKIEVLVPSALYDLTSLASEIANQEAAYCYFEYVGYMILYPQVDIKKYTMSDSTKIYTLKDKISGKIFNIATRSCAIRPGV